MRSILHNRIQLMVNGIETHCSKWVIWNGKRQSLRLVGEFMEIDFQSSHQNRNEQWGNMNLVVYFSPFARKVSVFPCIYVRGKTIADDDIKREKCCFLPSSVAAAPAWLAGALDKQLICRLAQANFKGCFQVVRSHLRYIFTHTMSYISPKNVCLSENYS